MNTPNKSTLRCAVGALQHRLFGNGGHAGPDRHPQVHPREQARPEALLRVVDERLDAARRRHRLFEVGVLLQRVDHRLHVAQHLGRLHLRLLLGALLRLRLGGRAGGR